MTIRLIIPLEFMKYYDTGGLSDVLAREIVSECRTSHLNNTIEEYLNKIDTSQLINYMIKYLETRGMDKIFQEFTNSECEIAALYNVMRLYEYDTDVLGLVFYCFSGGLDVLYTYHIDIESYSRKVLKDKYCIDIDMLKEKYWNDDIVKNFPGYLFSDRMYICILMQLELYRYNRPVTQEMNVAQYAAIGILSCMTSIDIQPEENPIINFIKDSSFNNEFVVRFCAYILIKIYRHGSINVINPFVIKFIITVAKTAPLNSLYQKEEMVSSDLNDIYRYLSDTNSVTELIRNPMPFIPKFMNSLQPNFFRGTDILIYGMNDCTSIEDVSKELIIAGRGDLELIQDAIKFLVNTTRYFRRLLPNQFNKLDRYIYGFSALYNDPYTCKDIYINSLMEADKSSREIRKAISNIKDESIRNRIESNYTTILSSNMIITADITI